MKRSSIIKSKTQMQQRINSIRLALVETRLARASSGTVVGPLVANALSTNSVRIANETEETKTAGPLQQAYWRVRINGINYRIALRSDLLAPVPFVIRVGPSVSTFTLPLVASGKYRFSVQWGDGNADTIMSHDQAERAHTYASAGEYVITITGTLVGWRFANNADAPKLLDVQQWGSDFIMGIDEGQYFFGCVNMAVSATDVPNLAYTHSMLSAFRDCRVMNPSSAPDWNVSNVRDLAGCFINALAFNQPIGTWDVSNATSLTAMFLNFIGSMAFNQPLNDWDVSKVTTFFQLFEGCQNFNQRLDKWNTSSCTSFYSMFRNTAFNQPIDSWNTSNVTNLAYMFRDCSFNQYIGSWDTSQVTTMYQMFYTDQIGSFNNGELGYDVLNINASVATYTLSTRTLSCTGIGLNVVANDVVIINAVISSQQRVISAVVESITDDNNVVFKVLPAPNITANIVAGQMNRISKQVAGTKPLLWSTTALTNIGEMFRNNVYFNQNVSSWTTTNVTDANSAFSTNNSNYRHLFNNGQLIDGNTQPMGWTFPVGANLTNFRLNSRLTDENKPAQVA